MSITVTYHSDIKDGMVTILNSQNDSVQSNGIKDLLDYLCRNYNDTRNSKLTWNLDIFVSVILKALGVTLCNALADKNNGNRIVFKLVNGIPELLPIDIAPKGNGQLPPDTYYVTYARQVMLRVQSHDVEYASYFYNLSQFFEDDELVIDDVMVIKQRAKELMDAFYEMGLNPRNLSSPISVWEDNILKTLDIPLLRHIPLSGEELTDFQHMIEECRIGREWRDCCAIGHWKLGESYEYDVQSSFGYHLSRAYDYRHVEYFKKSDVALKDASDGILQGTVTIYPNVRYSPICFNDDTQITHPVNKTWQDVLTLKEIRWIYRHGIGEFKLDYGYFWKYKTAIQPFRVPLEKIFNSRSKGGLVKRLAKRIGASANGKLLNQLYPSGDINPFYSPLIGMQTIVNARLQVADFIYNNKLNESDNIIHITTDAVRTTKFIAIPEKIGMGEWRLEPDTPCISLSDGYYWTKEKTPHSLSYEKVVDMINSKPYETTYDANIIRRMTLGEAIAIEDLTKVGELTQFTESLDVNIAKSKHTYEFDKYPNNGGELLGNKYYGKSITGN